MTLRVALVGCGGVARSYRKCYARLPGVEWVLAVDPNEQTLADCTADGAMRTSKNFQDALSDDIDLVDISTPNHLHAEQAIVALSAGKHVLVQKPLSNSLADADRIVAAGEASDRTAGMFMSSYGNPLVWDIRSLIQQGKLGVIQGVHARDSHRGGLKSEKAAWRGSREMTGGGSFTQLSIHAINLISFWLDDKITDVAAWQQNRLCPNIGGDDCTVVLARFSNQTLATFASGYASDGMVRTLNGTKGRLSLVDQDTRLELQLDEPFHGDLIDYREPGTTQFYNVKVPAHDDVSNPHNVHRNFVEAVLHNRRPRFTLRDGRQDLAVVDAVHRSAEAGGTVTKVD